MKADTLTVKKVFGKDIRYLVPLFQRPYVWTKEDQWEPLWEDVTNVAEALMAQLAVVGPDEAAQAEEATPPHFLGAVVLDQPTNSVADIETRGVIDGQQRLTTLQLLLDAVQFTVAKYADKRSAKLLEKLVLNDPDVITVSDHAFKVWPTTVDQDAFRAAMDDNTDPADHQDSPVVQAHAFFADAAEQWINEGGEDDRLRRIGALSTTLQGLLQMVVIELEPHDNAQVIFETLNARGTPLLASDLVKNLLLQTAEKQHQDVHALYEKYWKTFDERDFWRKEVRQGRLTRPRIDVFLYYWLIMRRGEEVPTTNVFPVFGKYLASLSAKVESVMADLAACGDIYRRFDDIPASSPEGTFMYRWLTLDAQALTPVVLWLFQRSAAELQPQSRLAALKAIESWLVRRTLCRLTTKGYNTLFLNLLQELTKDVSGDAGTTTTGFLAEKTADAWLWPTDDQVREALAVVPLYTLLTRGRLRMILEALEDAYRGPKSEDEFVARGRLTIEHLMPQAWREHWAMPAEADDDPAVVGRRDRILHSIGNLTLVTAALNPALSNSAWAVKAPEIGKHSVLHLNKRIVDEHAGSWDEETIALRASHLADQAIAVWPRPASMGASG